MYQDRSYQHQFHLDRLAEKAWIEFQYENNLRPNCMGRIRERFAKWKDTKITRLVNPFGGKPTLASKFLRSSLGSKLRKRMFS